MHSAHVLDLGLNWDFEADRRRPCRTHEVFPHLYRRQSARRFLSDHVTLPSIFPVVNVSADHPPRFDEGMIAYTKWPDFFETYGRKVPTKWCDIPYSFAWGEPEKNFWDVIARFPKRQSKFNTSMATLDEVLPVMGMFDFEWIVKNASKVADDAALIVDVGGGKGQALQQIRKHHPNIPAERCVLQDRPVVIDEVNSLDQPGLRGVKTMPHNFFEEQPVKGEPSPRA